MKLYFPKYIAEADPGFQVRGGAHLKKLHRAEEGTKILGVFRVKNHYFTPKNHIFYTIAEGGAKIFGVFRVKNHDFTPKNHIFFNFRVGAHQVRPSPCIDKVVIIEIKQTCHRVWLHYEDISMFLFVLKTFSGSDIV